MSFSFFPIFGIYIYLQIFQQNIEVSTIYTTKIIWKFFTFKKLEKFLEKNVDWHDHIPHSQKYEFYSIVVV
jgi:hypothetical protein